VVGGVSGERGELGRKRVGRVIIERIMSGYRGVFVFLFVVCFFVVE
jgi:hypothetical protein